MKNRIQLTAAFVSILFTCRLAQAEVVDTVLTFDPSVVGSWAPVDFNNDGVDGVSFNFYGISTESSATFILEFAGNGNTQVIGQNSSAIPLNSGETISLTPVLGDWMDSGLQKYVWIELFNGDVVGVGAPGPGDYLGVRFQINNDWHLGWIRFGQLVNPSSPLPTLSWPSVLEFAYETNPNTAIVTPVPEPNFLQLGMLFTVFAVGKKLLGNKQLTI